MAGNYYTPPSQFMHKDVFVKYDTTTNPQTYTWTCPNGIYWVKATIISAGGGGGGSSSSGVVGKLARLRGDRRDQRVG